MFPLLFTYFISKVNRIAIECFNFVVEGLHCLKNSMITKIEELYMEENVELCRAKSSLS